MANEAGSERKGTEREPRSPGKGNGVERGRKLANGLGWFSIGLGLAELAAPRRVSRLAGLRDHAATLRLFGLREIASGIGILASKNKAPWIRARIAGDMLDLGGLLTYEGTHRARTLGATAAVAGVTALDVLCSRGLGGKSRELVS